MIMDLPNEFYYGTTIQKNDAYVIDGELKIRRTVSFRNVVKELTFNLKGGKNICAYCGKSIEYSKMTIDHVYPQTMGGPTITNNLVPACRKCNSDKTDMTFEEYMEWCSFSTEDEQKKFLNLLRRKKEGMRRRKEYQIPEDWISKKRITTILLDVKLEDCSQTKKYRKIESFFNEYQYFQKPIVLDKNRFLIDGYNTVIFAKDHHILEIPIIQLDNVEVIL